jgi:hypothetical protein
MFERLLHRPAIAVLGAVILVTPLTALVVTQSSAGAGTAGSGQVAVSTSCGTTHSPVGGSMTFTFSGLPAGTVIAPASVTALGPNLHFTLTGLGWTWQEPAGELHGSRESGISRRVSIRSPPPGRSEDRAACCCRTRRP